MNKPPLYNGLHKLFPRALAAVAECARDCQAQHTGIPPEEDKDIRWDWEQGGDPRDKIIRHLVAPQVLDDDGIRHAAKVAIRALHLLEKEMYRDEVTTAFD